MQPIDAENRTTISSATLTDSPSRHTPKRRQELAGRLYNFVFQQALAGVKFGGRTAA